MTPQRWDAVSRFLNALMIYILVGILGGALYFQLGLHENPCPLCLLQRMGMMGVMCGAVLNLRGGIRPQNYGLIILAALFGAGTAARQILLHIVPGTGGYGDPVMGLHLYTWSFISEICILIGVGVLLLLYGLGEAATRQGPPPPVVVTRFEQVACLMAIGITAFNVILTFKECGLTACCENGPCP